MGVGVRVGFGVRVGVRVVVGVGVMGGGGVRVRAGSKHRHAVARTHRRRFRCQPTKNDCFSVDPTKSDSMPVLYKFIAEIS